MLMVVLYAFAVGVISFVLTAWLRRYALAKSLMDIPNERSSHVIPTPRGGGVAIVITYILALLIWDRLFEFSLGKELLIGLLGSGLLVSVLGFLDDHGHIAARWRLLGHFTSAAWLLYWLGGLPALSVFGGEVDFGWLGSIFAAIYLVWLLNLYNFMDGIDGIASIEAITTCLSATLLYYLTDNSFSAASTWILAFSVVGFLLWNFPPARIFMGDAGSGFLGLTLGGLSIQASWVEPDLLWGWLILLGVFVVDATYTLLRRLVRGEKVYEAHCSHAYQNASRVYGQHRPVTLSVLFINIGWLLPMACLVIFGVLDGLSGLILAYLPLIALAVYFCAGSAECTRLDRKTDINSI